MKNTMNRGRSQVIWRYLPKSTFRFNESGGWCEVGDVTIRDPKPLSAAVANALGHELRRWNAISPTAYPDPDTQAGQYEMGEPHAVMYDLWPLVFVCRLCGRTHWYPDLDRLNGVNDRLSCRSCRQPGVLRQVPYAYVCECGEKEPVYIAKHATDHKIVLRDKGSFEDSYWYCEDCKIPLRRNPREGLGYRGCKCGKAKRGVLLQDTRSYYAQTLQLVQVEPTVLDRWRDNPRFPELLAAASVAASCYRPQHLLELASRGPANESGASPEIQAMRDALINRGMSVVEVEELIQDSLTRAAADPWAAYERANGDLFGGAIPALHDSRQTVEYIFTRDEPTMGSLTLGQMRADSEAAGDSVTASRLRGEELIAADLGLRDLAVVEALPLLLAGYGYTRYFPAPQASDDSDGSGKKSTLELRSFPAHRNKIPIYTAQNTTEAFAYRLDPWRLAAFLERNAVAQAPRPIESEPHLRAWLLRVGETLVRQHESHLVLTPWEEQADQQIDLPSAFLFGVLHSVSHVLKATAHRYVGLDADSLAEYLFPAHSSGLLYVSSHVAFTLGGIDSVVRSNLSPWLQAAREFAGQCSFDPVCSASGGACLACLYPKFGCGYFNRTVSRAFLFGGRILGHSEPVTGFWEDGVAELGAQLKKESGG